MSGDTVEFEGIETQAVTVDEDSIGDLAYLVPPDSGYVLNADEVRINVDGRTVELSANDFGQVAVSVRTEGSE